VRANGWEKALAELLPTKTPKKSLLTVGDFLGEIEKTADAESRTIRSYASAFRTILADAFGIDPAGKYACQIEGQKVWRQLVHAIQLAETLGIDPALTFSNC
jgi:hypothetical protein